MSSRYEQYWREAMSHYYAGEKPGDSVKDSLLAEYRCRRNGCLLLHVWSSPNGPEFYAPSARVSKRFQSAGQLHWLSFNRSRPQKTGESAGRINDPVISRQWLWLLCPHVKGPLWTVDLRQDIEGVEPGRPVRINLPRDTPGHTEPDVAL